MVIGIEPGREGVIDRAIVPILVAGEVVGSVEGGYDIKDYLKEFYANKGSEYLYIPF